MEKCDGCKGQDKTACMYICPNDLMMLNKETMKAWNDEPEMCWECYNCVKICPQQAIDVRGYADFVPMGASVVPLRGSEDIMWTVSSATACQRFVPSDHGEGSAKPMAVLEVTTDWPASAYQQPEALGSKNCHSQEALGVLSTSLNRRSNH
jgi:adenylylsulfate reductase subunit B